VEVTVLEVRRGRGGGVTGFFEESTEKERRREGEWGRMKEAANPNPSLLLSVSLSLLLSVS
jgi:hypothetical protein